MISWSSPKPGGSARGGRAVALWRQREATFNRLEQQQVERCRAGAERRCLRWEFDGVGRAVEDAREQLGAVAQIGRLAPQEVPQHQLVQLRRA